jgi:hypothetical protein
MARALRCFSCVLRLDGDAVGDDRDLEGPVDHLRLREVRLLRAHLGDRACRLPQLRAAVRIPYRRYLQGATR